MPINHLLTKSTGLKQWVFKKLTLIIFVILPARITSVFVSLSIINLLYSVRSSDFISNSDAVKRVEEMLRIRLDESILLLPERTYRWYWDNDILSTTMSTKDGVFPMRQLITDSDMLADNWDRVLDRLLGSLPKCMITKLKLKDAVNRLVIKHSVRVAVLHSA